MTQINADVMKNLQLIAQLLKSQGLGVGLIALFAYYMHGEKVALQSQVNNCNDQLITIYKEQSEANRKALDENTKVLQLIIENKE